MCLTVANAGAQRLEADYKAVTDAEKAEVVKLGGLHVVGTERHVRACSIHPPVPSVYLPSITMQLLLREPV